MTESVNDPYTAVVHYEWDDTKSERNSLSRGLPFELAVLLFDGPLLQAEDKRRDYGERRFRALGTVEGEVLACVFTDRAPDIRRIISLRRASRRERDAYRAAFPEGDRPEEGDSGLGQGPVDD